MLIVAVSKFSYGRHESKTLARLKYPACDEVNAGVSEDPSRSWIPQGLQSEHTIQARPREKWT